MEAKTTRCVFACTDMWKFCKKCNAKECLECQSGYKKSGDKCVENTSGTGSDKPTAAYSRGLAWTAANPGDRLSGGGGGVSIPNSVTICTAGSSCPNASTKPTCWQGTTSSNYTTVNNYSGANRTVCNWAAANEICAHHQMRLPTERELMENNLFTTANFSSNISMSMCSNSSCADASTCKGAYNDVCSPQGVWSQDKDLLSSNYTTYYLNGSSWTSASTNKNSAKSVRCMVECARKFRNCKECNFEKCTKCQYGYSWNTSEAKCARNNEKPQMEYVSKFGIYMTKANPGDEGGAIIPDNGSVTICTTDSPCSSALTSAICWQGQTAATGLYSKGNYSGENRTVCNWHAAEKICEYNNMSLPTKDQIVKPSKICTLIGCFGSYVFPLDVGEYDYSIYDQDYDLQLCTYTGLFGRDQCWAGTRCLGSYASDAILNNYDAGNNCGTQNIWTSDHYFISRSMLASFHRFGGLDNEAKTVRCVKK
jgi:hypothetical protein